MAIAGSNKDTAGTGNRVEILVYGFVLKICTWFTCNLLYYLLILESTELEIHRAETI